MQRSPDRPAAPAFAVREAHPADLETLVDRWQPTVPVPASGLLAVRLQVHRPTRATVAREGIVACSNPVYLADTAPETTHRVRALIPAAAGGARCCGARPASEPTFPGCGRSGVC